MRFTLKNPRFLQYIDYQNVRKTEFLGCQSQELLAGVDWFRSMIGNGSSAAEISARWASDVENFKSRRAPYLLYPEK